MKYLYTILLLLAASVIQAQVIGSSLIGCNPGNPARYNPALWLDSSPQYCFTDAAIQFTAADKSWLQILDASQTGLDVGTDDYLISSWVYCDSLPTYSTICSKIGGYNLLLRSNGAIQFSLGSGGGTVTVESDAGTITTGAWKHISVYCDRSGNATIYVNGAPVKAGSVTSLVATNLDNASTFSVGALATPLYQGISLFPFSGGHFLTEVGEDFSINLTGGQDVNVMGTYLVVK